MNKSVCIALALLSTSLIAEDKQEPIDITVVASKVAVEIPASTFPSVTTPLRFDPLVDLQDRNFAEAQSDISIRGGIFDHTGVEIGSASMFDPQTGHYTTEIPVPVSMLGNPEIRTGLEQALFGFQGVAGGVSYQFSELKTGGSLSAGVGDRRLNTQDLDVGFKGDGGLGLQVSGARSEQNGTEVGGESELWRGAARAQYSTGDSQTDLFYGHLDKKFQWPYLYALEELHTLVASSGIESDNTETNLVILNHRENYNKKSYLEASAWHRELKDDYEFDVFQPGLFNAFEHKTKVSGLSVRGDDQNESWFIKYNALAAFDSIDSTALVFGPYDTRSAWTLSVLPGIKLPADEEEGSVYEIYAGPRYDDSNRAGGDVGVLGGIALAKEDEEGDSSRIYLEVSQASQAPNYTAISSNPSGGLFRGNPYLLDLRSTNAEVGIKGDTAALDYGTALFFRRDNNLTDWTYDSSIVPFASRSANNVDIDTLGGEMFVSFSDESKRTITLGYTYLHKDSEYAIEGIDASFYALNFPRHRVTASVSVPITDELQFMIDNEIRRQIKNSLREGTRTPLISSLALVYAPSWLEGFSVTGVVDNLFNTDFEEVPGVPGQGQLASVNLRYNW